MDCNYLWCSNMSTNMSISMNISTFYVRILISHILWLCLTPVDIVRRLASGGQNLNTGKMLLLLTWKPFYQFQNWYEGSTTWLTFNDIVDHGLVPSISRSKCIFSKHLFISHKLIDPQTSSLVSRYNRNMRIEKIKV